MVANQIERSRLEKRSVMKCLVAEMRKPCAFIFFQNAIIKLLYSFISAYIRYIVGNFDSQS